MIEAEHDPGDGFGAVGISTQLLPQTEDEAEHAAAWRAQILKEEDEALRPWEIALHAIAKGPVHKNALDRSAVSIISGAIVVSEDGHVRLTEQAQALYGVHGAQLFRHLTFDDSYAAASALPIDW